MAPMLQPAPLPRRWGPQPGVFEAHRLGERFGFQSGMGVLEERLSFEDRVMRDAVRAARFYARGIQTARRLNGTGITKRA